MDNILPLVVTTRGGVPVTNVLVEKPNGERVGKSEKKNACQGAKTKEDRSEKYVACGNCSDFCCASVKHKL